MFTMLLGEKLHGRFNTIFHVILMAVCAGVTSTVLNLITLMSQITNSVWYENNVDVMSNKDIHFMEKNTMIFTMWKVLGIAVIISVQLLIILFIVSYVLRFTNRIKIMNAVGYNQLNLYKYLFYDSGINIVLISLFAYIISNVMWHEGLKYNVFANVVKLSGSQSNNNIIYILISVLSIWILEVLVDIIKVNLQIKGKTL